MVINNFLIYFRKQFIAGNETPHPSNEISFWNCHFRVINCIPRTTNTLEGWHMGLNDSFNRAHPNLVAFLVVLAPEEQRIFVKKTQMDAGNIFLSMTWTLKRNTI